MRYSARGMTIHLLDCKVFLKSIYFLSCWAIREAGALKYSLGENWGYAPRKAAE